MNEEIKKLNKEWKEALKECKEDHGLPNLTYFISKLLNILAK